MENPYETPSTTPQEDNYTEATERTIPDTPHNLEASWCISRGWRLTCQNFGLFFKCIMLPLIIVGVINIILSSIAVSVDGQTTEVVFGQVIVQNNTGVTTVILNIISNILSTVIGMGIIRVVLDYLDGKEVSFNTALSQTNKLVTGVIASFFFGLVVGLGLILLIVPGIYLATKYGFFLHAIVDKNCGIMDSFKYSDQLTRNNKMNIFVLFLLSFLVTLAGALALLVGLLWAYPTVILAMTIAYCSLHHGKSKRLEEI